MSYEGPRHEELSVTPEVPFNRPHVTGREFDYIRQAIERSHLSGGGTFARKCEAWLEEHVGCARVLLAHSGTGALEMAALVAGLERGDEVIMPSFTFASTANAFALRGAVPVFVDIRPDTLNLDEKQVEAAITPKTRAVVPVHYAGVSCEMETISALAESRELMLIEDAAQGLLASYDGRSLGTFGQTAVVSFHETKNVTCGEGGALLINDERLIERAEIIQEKGTNRSRFFRGQIDKYTWVDLGSSYVLSEINAAFLWAQLQAAESITARRMAIWDQYFHAFEALEHRGLVRRPIVPDRCRHNAHLFYLLVRDLGTRTRVLDELRRVGVIAVFHYVPLHSSAAGRRYGRTHGDLETTNSVADRLIRLPLWVELSDAQVKRVIDGVTMAVT